jgi:hypothetical protein
MMSIGKIDFSLGALSFSGEGEQDWLAAQLDKLLEAAPKLQRVASLAAPEVTLGAKDGDAQGRNFTDTLASYIKEKDGDSNQVNRFLATADWLRQRGSSNLTTAAVSKALSINHQKKLGNPADCLNKNVAKGHCEKKGDGFFITSDGLRALGHTA